MVFGICGLRYLVFSLSVVIWVGLGLISLCCRLVLVFSLLLWFDLIGLGFGLFSCVAI